jgi:hypothetical protein
MHEQQQADRAAALRWLAYRLAWERRLAQLRGENKSHDRKDRRAA